MNKFCFLPGGAQVEHAACRYRHIHHIQTPKSSSLSGMKSHRQLCYQFTLWSVLERKQGPWGGEQRPRLSYSTPWSSPIPSFLVLQCTVLGKSPLKNTTVLNLCLSHSVFIIPSISENKISTERRALGLMLMAGHRTCAPNQCQGDRFSSRFQMFVLRATFLSSFQASTAVHHINALLRVAPHQWLTEKNKHTETEFHTLDPIPLALSLHASLKSLSIYPVVSHRALEGALRCPRSNRFSRLSNPNSLSLSS